MMSRLFMFLTILALLSGSAQAGMVVSDDNLHDDWVYGGIFTTGVGRTFIGEADVDTGGNPAKYRSMSAAHGGLRSQTMTIRFFSIDTGFMFNPALGPLTALSVSFDGMIESQQKPTDSVAFGVGLRQGGSLFYHATTKPGSFAWQQFDFPNLTQNDFVSAGPTLPQTMPDFSTSGAPIEFGYFAYTSSFFTSSASVGTDNWRLEVNPQAAAVGTAPEPSSMTLLVIGALGFVGCHWRRNRGSRS